MIYTCFNKAFHSEYDLEAHIGHRQISMMGFLCEISQLVLQKIRRQPLTIITKCPILDVAAVLDLPL